MVKLRRLFLLTRHNVATIVTLICGVIIPHACCNSLLSFEYPEAKNSLINLNKEKEADQDIVTERFSINIEDGFLIIPVTLKGKRYKFVLDTGSSEGVYDTSFRSILSAPIKIVKIQRFGLPDKLVPMYKSPECCVGKIVIPKGSGCFCMDLEGIREASGLEINGILGMDFLKRQILRIDFDKNEVAFLQNVGSDPGIKVPLLFRGNWPHVMVKFQGIPGARHFLVDTGCSGPSSGNLLIETFEELKKNGINRVERGKSEVESITGTQERRFGYINDLFLGDFHHKQLLFSESNKNILGLGYWSRYVVIFDFPNSAIYLKKGKQFYRPDLSNMSGLVFRRRNEKTIVAKIIDGSPADHAGIKLDDVLLKVDKINVSEISLCRINHMLCEKNKKYRLLVLRGAKELKFTISLPR